MKKIFISPIIFLLLFLSFNTVFAQNSPQEKQSYQVEEVELDLIPVIQIPQKIDELYVFLKKINAVEIPSTEINKLEESFNIFLENIEQLKKESTKDAFENITTKKLKDFSLKWNSHLVSIGSFKRKLQNASERLAKEREQIEKILVGWEKTYSNSKKEKAPKQLMNSLV